MVLVVCFALLQLQKPFQATFLQIHIHSRLLHFIFIFRISKCLYLLYTLLFTLVLGNVLSLSVVPVHFISFTVG